MANWQDPRPLFPWSAPPEHQGPRGAPKLRPNIYARMARFAVQNPVGVLLASLFLLATALTVSALNLSFDLGHYAQTSGGAQIQRAPEAAKFQAESRTIWIDLTAEAPGSASAAATSLAESLKTQTALVETVIVPGPGALDAKFRPYFLPLDDLQKRVDGILSLGPYYQLLAASPNLAGLNNTVATIKAAADAGQVPAALAPFLDTLAQSVQRLADGKASSVAWPEATGLANIPAGTSQSLFVIAREGELPAVIDATHALLSKLQAEKPFLNVTSNMPATSEAIAAPSSMRQIVVALFLATLFLVSSLAFGLRSPRHVFFAIVPAAIAGLVALALAPALIGPLDAAAAMIPMLIVPGTLALSVPYVLALERHEKKAIATQSLIMLAAQQSGTYIATSAAIVIVTWVSWWVFGGSGARGLAMTMAIAELVCAAATLLVVPTLAFIIPRERIEIVPAAQLAANGRSNVMPVIAAARSWVTIAMVALAALSALAVVASLLRGPAASSTAVPASVYAANLTEAQRVVDALQSQTQSVGRVRWLGSYLPGDADAKLKHLQRLSTLNLPVAPAAATPAQQAATLTKKIDDGLKDIANRENLPRDLRDSAQRLRRTIALVQGTAASPGVAAASIEGSLFSGLPRFGGFVAASAAVQPPTTADLPEELRQLFAAPDGSQRIEVSPEAPTVSGESFATALASAQPQASDTQPQAGGSKTAELLMLLSIAVSVACAVFLSPSLLRSLSAVVAFAVTLSLAAVIFAGLAYVLGLGFNAATMIAMISGLVCCAVCCLWSLSEETQQWATPLGFGHMLQSSVAASFPLLLLNLVEFRLFAVAVLLFVGIAAVLSIFAVAKLENWFASALTRRSQKPAKPTQVEPRAPALDTKKQVSTIPTPDDKKAT